MVYTRWAYIFCIFLRALGALFVRDLETLRAPVMVVMMLPFFGLTIFRRCDDDGCVPAQAVRAVHAHIAEAAMAWGRGKRRSRWRAQSGSGRRHRDMSLPRTAGNLLPGTRRRRRRESFFLPCHQTRRVRQYELCAAAIEPVNLRRTFWYFIFRAREAAKPINGANHRNLRRRALHVLLPG